MYPRLRHLQAGAGLRALCEVGFHHRGWARRSCRRDPTLTLQALPRGRLMERRGTLGREGRPSAVAGRLPAAWAPTLCATRAVAGGLSARLASPRPRGSSEKTQRDHSSMETNSP